MEGGSILITGANRGIGFEFVRQLVKADPPPKFIFATCRNPDGAEELNALAQKNKNLKVLKLAGQMCPYLWNPVGEEATYQSACKEVSQLVGDQGLNIVFNNAGTLTWNTFESVTAEVMAKEFAVDCIGPVMITKAFYPLLKQAAAASKKTGLSCSRAAVLNMTSGMGLIGDNGSGKGYSYRAAKAALDMVTKSMSIDFKPDGILAVALVPGWVATDMGGKNAAITPETCVSSLLTVMGNLTENETGKCMKYDGKDCGY